MTKRTVLVTGGTGFTGSYLLRKLCALGYEVRAIRRASSDITSFESLPIKWFVGEVYDPDLLRSAMTDVQVVFHLAAAYRATNLPDSELYNVHVTSTRLLAKLALEQDNFERFVHVSTVGVLGHIENPPVDESAEYNPGDIYQETKTEAEKWMLEFAPQHDLPFTIIRPAAIYGPGDRRLLKFFKIAKLPIMPLIGFTKGLYHLIHVEDLVEFIHFSSTTDQTLSNVYICGDPKANSLKDMLQIISEDNGKKARFIRIPSSPLFFIARIIEAISKKLNVEPFLYPRRVAFFTKDRSFITSKMQAVEGFDYKYSANTGLTELNSWYKKEGWL